uniref:NADH-ubiquinone oxidoreductase chain 2 n=1 Tax=Pherbellia dubia TaxID=2719086 RepID=A0A7D6W9D4_9MUSC|nr:NADH dehydrogenase subunit 2 [Pherbellia dubia]
MFNNSSKIMFGLIIMMSTLMTVSANSWLSAWMGLEINLLSFIPLMSDNNLMSTEASLKYFLTQALASAVLLFSIILFMLENKIMLQYNMNYSSLMIISSLLMKSGAAPFHFWFPNVMEGLSWMNALILMTWQKIAPMMLLSYLIYNDFILLSVIFSSMMGSLGGLNQTSLRKLMAYSSINHLGWMLMAMYSSEMLWLNYFLFYSFLSFSLILFFNLFKMFHLNQLFSNFFHSPILSFILLLNLLSLGGLPPFLGFFPKWMVIQSLTENYQLSFVIILTVTTLITLYFYLRLCYSAFMLSYHETNWSFKILFNSFSMNLYLWFSFMSTVGMMLISLFYMMF